MSMKTEAPRKRRTAAQRASDVNHKNQLEMNARLGTPAPQPRDIETVRAAHEARHGGWSGKRR